MMTLSALQCLYRLKMVESMIEINCKLAVIQNVSSLGPKISPTMSAMNLRIIEADEIS